MNFKKILLVVSLVASVSDMAFAQNQNTDLNDASIALGYVGTTGNTDTTSLNTEVLLKFGTVRWTNNLKFQALGSQEDDASTAERYFLDEKSDFNLDDRQYIFGKGTYDDDRFSGYEYQATATAGYGRYFFKQANYTLQGFGGAGYRKSDVVNAGSENEGIFTVGQNLSWQFSPSSSIVQSLTSDIGGDITISRFELGLVSNLLDRVATKIAFQARNTSEVPLGNKKTDTQTSVSLIYSF